MEGSPGHIRAIFFRRTLTESDRYLSLTVWHGPKSIGSFGCRGTFMSWEVDVMDEFATWWSSLIPAEFRDLAAQTMLPESWARARGADMP